jgi:DNA-binding NtrC family response regulator
VSARPTERRSPGYHEARLGELVDHVAEAVDRFRAGELDAFAVDEVLHQYQRAARELWKFCWLGGSGAGVELTARALHDMADQDERADR